MAFINLYIFNCRSTILLTVPLPRIYEGSLNDAEKLVIFTYLVIVTHVKVAALPSSGE